MGVEQITMVVKGTVQGVGFRPRAYRLAYQNQLLGYVQNLGDSVRIVLQGQTQNIERFRSELVQTQNSPIRIESLEVAYEKLTKFIDFTVRESQSEGKRDLVVPPDHMICEECWKDFSTPGNIRHNYPFVACSECGPRYSLVQKLPFDRANTSMHTFPLCQACRSEYQDPSNRRFHSEGICCPDCGPRLYLADAQWNKLNFSSQKEIFSFIRQRINQDDVVALKGLGGYLLTVNARSKSAIRKLRNRKDRPHKPFALMARNIEVIEELCYVSSFERQLLLEPQIGPIVILEVRDETLLPIGEIAPDQKTVGIMLPTTPMHKLLFEDGNNRFDFLIMTSGNRRGEPLCRTDEEAAQRLNGLVDFFLSHDREIINTVDDSIVMEATSNKMTTLRRARGLAPEMTRLKRETSKVILSLGGQLKNTVCLAYKNEAIVSPYIGDLFYYDTFLKFQEYCQNFPRFVLKTPELIVTDLHPDYESTRFGSHLAAELSIPHLSVQHHHAHAVACMAEHHIEEALAIIFDGTGLGTDGSLWGGEFLRADYKGFDRLATFCPSSLPSGERTVLYPIQQALIRLVEAGVNINHDDLNKKLQVSHEALNFIKMALQLNGGSDPKTSSVGRLFDAVAAILGLAQGKITYEGQAAIRLESLARRARVAPKDLTHRPYEFKIKDSGGFFQIDSHGLIKQLFEDVQHTSDISQIAYQFHKSLAIVCCDMVEQLRNTTKLNKVVLSGGVFQNKLLLTLVVDLLKARNFLVFFSERIPCNDAGISLGQAVIGGAQRCMN